MNLTIRKYIARVKPIHTLARVFMYNSSIFFYLRKNREMGLKKRILELKQTKRGKRCFIIGNGPSLSVKDLEKLVNEDCFASNQIFKLFDQTTWRPKYYLVKDRYFNSSTEVIDTLDIENVFVGDYYWRYHNTIKRKDAICLHEKYSFNEEELKVSDDITKGFYSGSTVSFGLMQIAAYMGYAEMYLLGFDHNYRFEFDKKGRVVTTKTENVHFYADDVPEDIIANVRGMTKAYESFAKYAKSHGITVKNATRGGKLEVFERIDFDSLFN